MIDYKIISTGSKGNAVVLNDIILIDCGVSFKALTDVYKQIKIVLLTHIHADHFNRTTLRLLAERRPTLRFACCEWLIPDLLGHESGFGCGIPQQRIDVLEIGKIYDYGAFKVSPVKLYHDVPNCGYRLFFGKEKAFYATDTSTLAGIAAKDYDLYLIEANHEEDEIKQRISEKKANGEFAYELRARKNHLSKEQCDAWVYENIGNGEYVYLHQHQERK